MTKKQLQEHYWLRQNIKKLEEKLLELETEAKRMTAVYNNINPSKRNTSKDRLSEIVAKIVDTQNEINELTVQAYEKMLEIEKAILKLPNRERYLIRLRYIECMSWYEIMEEMNYSWRQVHRIHADALKTLAG